MVNYQTIIFSCISVHETVGLIKFKTYKIYDRIYIKTKELLNRFISRLIDEFDRFRTQQVESECGASFCVCVCRQMLHKPI